MKNKKLVISLIIITLFIMTGCLGIIKYEKQRIEVQKRVGIEDKYEDFKEVTDNGQVRKVKEILHNIDWKNCKVNMSRFADYQFIFQFKNPKIEAKAVLFEVWINNDRVEIIEGDTQYTKLTKEDSEFLIEIISRL